MAHTPTPGPWRVGYSTPNYRTESALSVLPGNAIDGHPVRPVCKLSPESSEDDEDRANAKLIAAAPDLLNACNEAIEQINTYIGEWSGVRPEYQPVHLQRFIDLQGVLSGAVFKAQQYEQASPTV